MADCTPSRTSKRLDLKRKKDGPEAVSAVKKFRLTSRKNVSPSGDETDEDYSPSKTARSSHKSQANNKNTLNNKRKQPRQVLKVKLDKRQRSHKRYPDDEEEDENAELGSPDNSCLDFDGEYEHNGKLVGKDAKRSRKSIELLASAECTPFEFTSEEKTSSSKAENSYREALVETLSSIPSDENEEIFDIAGAVIPPSVAEELNASGDDWIQNVTDACQVEISCNQVKDVHIAIGSPHKLIATKQFIEQLVSVAKEKKRKELEEKNCKDAIETEVKVEITEEIPGSPDPKVDSAKTIKSSVRRKGKRGRRKKCPPTEAGEENTDEETESAAVNKYKPGRNKKSRAVRNEFKCSICLMDFISDGALLKHSSHHRSQPIPDKAPLLSEGVDFSEAFDEFYEVVGNKEEKNSSPDQVTNNRKADLESDNLNSFEEEQTTTVEQAEISLEASENTQIQFSPENQPESNKEVSEVKQSLKPADLAISCEICSMYFLSKQKYQVHFRSHFDDEGNVVTEQPAENSESRSLRHPGHGETTVLNEEDENQTSNAGDSEQILDIMMKAMLQSSDNPVDKTEDKLQSSETTPESEVCDVVQCDQCGYECTSQLLEYHKARVHSNKNFCCPFCKRKIKELADLELHYTQHFDREGKIRDEFLQVDLALEERQELERMWAENPQVLPQAVVAKAEQLQAAVKEKKDSRHFKCKFCTFTSKSEKGIKGHIHRHIKSKTKDVHCDICAEILPSKLALKKHMACVHEVEDNSSASHAFDVKALMAEIDPSAPHSWEDLRLPEEISKAFTFMEPTKETIEELQGLLEKCEACDFVGSSSSVNRHKQREHRDKTLECPYCPKNFSVKLDLSSHVKNYHLDTEGKLRSERVVQKGKEPVNAKHKFMCRVCGQRGTESAVKLHIETKHKPGGFPCDQCDAVLSSKLKLNQHKKTHMSKQEMEQAIKERKRFKAPRFWVCHLCPYTTRHSETDLKEHISRKHEPPKHKCEYCGKMFGVLYDMRDHINHMHLKTKRVMCDICGQTMHFKNLKLHKQRIHDNYRPHKCDICGLSFSEKRQLERHKSRHQPKETRATTVFCKICNKAYVSEKTLRDHMNKHNGVKPYQCDKCDATFGIRAIWLRHRKNHERGQLQCPYSGCSYQALKESVMNKHLYKRHKDTSQQPLVWSSPLPPTRTAEQDPVMENSNLDISGADAAATRTLFIKQEGDQAVLQVDIEQQPDHAVAIEKEDCLQVAEEEDETSARIYMCSICQDVFSTLEDTQQHMVIAHSVQVEAVAADEAAILEEQANEAPVVQSVVAAPGHHIEIDAEMNSAPAVLIDEDGQPMMYALTSTGSLEPIEGVQLEAADSLAELSSLPLHSVVQTEDIPT